MSSIPHIDTLHSTAWVPWMVFILSMNLFLAEWTHRGYIRTCLVSLWGTPERRYEDSPKILTKLFSTIFSLGTFALAFFVAFYREGEVTIPSYLLIVMGIVGLWIIKNIFLSFVGYVFDFDGDVPALRQHMMGMWVIFGTLLTFCVLLEVHFPETVGHPWVFRGILIAYWVLILGKMVRNYMRKALSLLYIVLYFVTLEVLPIIGIILYTQHVMQVY